MAIAEGFLYRSDETPSTGGGIPAGGIIMWSGATNNIPSGWALCDGSNGTPNLQDKFLVGAGSGYAVGATGGSADAIVPNHTHPTSIDGGHVIPATAQTTFSYGGAGTYSSTIFSMSNTGGGQSHENRPPYYAVTYIIKT